MEDKMGGAYNMHGRGEECTQKNSEIIWTEEITQKT